MRRPPARPSHAHTKTPGAAKPRPLKDKTVLTKKTRPPLPLRPLVIGRAEPWIAALQQHFGFTLSAITPDNSSVTRRIGKTHDRDGRVWPVYLSSILHDPANANDRDAEAAQNLVKAQSDHALLFFYAVCVIPAPRHPDDKQTPDAIIYGGKILRDGRWLNFAMPKHGIDELTSHREDPVAFGSKDFIERHTIKGGAAIAIAVATQAPIIAAPNLVLQRIESTHGWTMLTMVPKSLSDTWSSRLKLQAHLESFKEGHKPQ
jgi:hypothetical protein